MSLLYSLYVENAIHLSVAATAIVAAMRFTAIRIERLIFELCLYTYTYIVPPIHAYNQHERVEEKNTDSQSTRNQSACVQL